MIETKAMFRIENKGIVVSSNNYTKRAKILNSNNKWVDTRPITLQQDLNKKKIYTLKLKQKKKK